MPPLRVPSGLLDCVDFSEQSLTAMQQSYVLRGCTGATVNLWGKKEWRWSQDAEGEKDHREEDALSMAKSFLWVLVLTCSAA